MCTVLRFSFFLKKTFFKITIWSWKENHQSRPGAPSTSRLCGAAGHSHADHRHFTCSSCQRTTVKSDPRPRPLLGSRAAFWEGPVIPGTNWSGGWIALEFMAANSIIHGSLISSLSVSRNFTSFCFPCFCFSFSLFLSDFTNSFFPSIIHVFHRPTLSPHPSSTPKKSNFTHSLARAEEGITGFWKWLCVFMNAYMGLCVYNCVCVCACKKKEI